MASKFGDFLASYTAQIGAKETAKYNSAKADQARMDVNKNTISNTISELHNNEKIFDSSGRLNKTTGLEAMHDPNIAGQYVKFMNTSSVATQFKNQFGAVERGEILAPTKVGENQYVFNVRKKNGKIVPLTQRRSDDPNDKPLVLSKEQLVGFYEAQSENLLQKGGLTGRAIAKTMGNFQDDQFQKAYGTAGEMLGDENIEDPEDLIDGYGQISEIVNNARSAEEKEAIANMSDGLEIEGPNAATKETVSKEGEGNQSFMGKDAQEFNEDGTPKEKPESEPFTYVDEESTAFKNLGNAEKARYIKAKATHETLAEKIETGVANPGTRMERKLTEVEIKAAKKKMGDLEKGPLARVDRINQAKSKKEINELERKQTSIQARLKNKSINPTQKAELEKELTDLNKNLDTLNAKGDTLRGGSESEFTFKSLPDLPDSENTEDMNKWFTNNQETLKNLPQEDYDQIKNILEKKNINSAAEMAEAVKKGALQRKDALKAAALIAFTVNAGATGDGAAVARQQSLFGTLANTFLQGDPNVDSNMAANTRSLIATRKQSSALAQSKFLQAGMQQYAESASKATDLLINDKGEFLDLRDDSAPGVAQAKQAMRKFFLDINTNKAFGTESAANPAVSHMMGEVLLSLGSQGSVGFMDWFSDFPNGDTVIPAAGDVMSRIRKRENSKGVVELVFVNASEPGAETEFSVLPDEFLSLVDTPSYNYTLTQVKSLVEDKPVKEVTGR